MGLFLTWTSATTSSAGISARKPPVRTTTPSAFNPDAACRIAPRCARSNPTSWYKDAQLSKDPTILELLQHNVSLY